MKINMKEFEGFNGTVDIIDYNAGDIIDDGLKLEEVEELIEGIYRIVKIEKNGIGLAFDDDNRTIKWLGPEDGYYTSLDVYVEEIED